MSLADRLSAAVPNGAHRGCGTCRWIGELPAEDREAFLDWVGKGWSLTQLWSIARNDQDHPYPMSLESLRVCARMHIRADKG